MSGGLNKQKLDELLGIVEEMEAAREKAAPAPKKEFVPGVGPSNPIPADLPGESIEEQKTLPADKGVKPAFSAVPVPAPATTSAVAPTPSSNDLRLENLDEYETEATKRSLTEIDSLVDVAKRVIDHVYSVVTSTDILDAQVVAAAAKLIKETKELVQEHLEIQKNQRDFLNQIQMEEIKHRHQMELMEKKYELEKMRFQQKNPPAATQPASAPVSQNAPAGMKSYSNADMMRMLEEMK